MNRGHRQEMGGGLNEGGEGGELGEGRLEWGGDQLVAGGCIPDCPCLLPPSRTDRTSSMQEMIAFEMEVRLKGNHYC